MSPYAEEDLLPLSALQHLAFCERQCALIHLEGIWGENALTAEGRQLHERAHESDSESRRALRLARGLRLRSLRLGLIGMSDVVEFYCLGEMPRNPAGASLPGIAGFWQAFPVEYKRGRPKRDHCDEIQLCAQAICLEEMLETTIPEGALFYGEPRRRENVSFTPGLRDETEALALRLHVLMTNGKTPMAHYSKKCDNCSLIFSCLPKVTEHPGSVGCYLSQAFPPKEDENE